MRGGWLVMLVLGVVACGSQGPTSFGGGGYAVEDAENFGGGQAPTVVLAMPIVVPLDAGDAEADGAADAVSDAAVDGPEDAAETFDGPVCDAGEIICRVNGCSYACYSGDGCPPDPCTMR
jgi:hypothetical protein